MILPEKLYNFLKGQGIDFYTGVPDSLLKDFLKYIQDHSSSGEHVSTANEGLAIGLASGYHFRTNKIPLVYLQNSGLGNIINPLTSLADKEMYAVPMLLMIGWRGKPGTKDEPQHSKMGRIMMQLLDTLEIPCCTLDTDETSSFKRISEAIVIAKKEQRPVALIVPESIFEKYEGVQETNKHELMREEVIKALIGKLSGDELVVCTTGKIGREFYEQNEMAGRRIKKYLLSVGAMGHANHVALGLKMQSDKKIIVLDGDGALLMQMGSLPTIAHHAKNDFIHIVINNGSHESVGGQPTEGFFADCCGIANASGYPNVICINNENELNEWLQNGLNSSLLQFVEIRTNKESRSNLGRPAGQPAKWKEDLMNELNKK
ncbi:MAG: phosphonopyruvate decarboxylase [Chitinophagaceae bacterium]|nr:phosphonopyruvate decarboxylase [Chitinophagaceae bacterium]